MFMYMICIQWRWTLVRSER